MKKNAHYNIRSSLVIAGQFPPPVNGFAYITQEICNFMKFHHETTRIDIAPHFDKNGVPYHFRRFLLTMKGIWLLLRNSFTKKRYFYIACEGGLGLFYTITLCTTARLLNFPIYIHHHSFSYIDTFSPLMKLLLSVTGIHAIHIFLCPVMAQLFSDKYQRTINSIILSNSAFVDDLSSTPRLWKSEQPLVIGLLSNLNDEKGLGIFLDVLHETSSENLNIVGILAGPTSSDIDRDKITVAKKELGDRLDYRGPLYGDDKKSFFESIDVFIFPTRYANEAQPTVLFEAMAFGIPILTYDRGCINGQVAGCGSVLNRDSCFVSETLDWLKTHMASPQTLQQLKIEAITAFLNDRAEAKQRLEVIFDLEPQAYRPSLH